MGWGIEIFFLLHSKSFSGHFLVAKECNNRKQQIWNLERKIESFDLEKSRLILVFCYLIRQLGYPYYLLLLARQIHVQFHSNNCYTWVRFFSCAIGHPVFIVTSQIHLSFVSLGCTDERTTENDNFSVHVFLHLSFMVIEMFVPCSVFSHFHVNLCIVCTFVLYRMKSMLKTFH
jgi:hypothetical protein